MTTTSAEVPAPALRALPTPRFRLLSPADAVAAAPPIEPVIRDLWVPSLTVITGQPFVGKSNLALMMADAVRAGAPFLGREVQFAGTPCVAYAALDTDGLSEIGQLARQLPHAGYGGLWLLSEPLPKPTDKDAWAGWIEDMGALGVTHLIVDNLTELIGAGDLNTNTGVYDAIRRLKEVGAAGIPVLLIHHAAAPGQFGESKRPMGHQAIGAAARLTVHMRARTGDYVVETQSNRSASVTLTIKIDHEHLTAEVVDERVGKASSERKRQRDMDAKRAKAHRLLEGATADDLKNQSALGRRAATLGLASGDGRNLVKALIGVNVLATDGRVITKGPNFDGPS
jgi:hypothetical protein